MTDTQRICYLALAVLFDIMGWEVVG